MSTETKWLFVGGDDESFPVVERGGHFVGIPDRRFEWQDWDGGLNAENLEPAEKVSGRDIVGIAQLTADADGRLALDKAHSPDGKYICVVWTADGRTRILQTVKVTEFGADVVQKRQATLPRQEPAEQVRAVGVVEVRAVAVEAQETRDAEAWKMMRLLDERLVRIECAVDAGNKQGTEILKHAKAIPAMRQTLFDAMEKPYELAAHLWQISNQIDAKWMPLFRAMVRHHANYTHAAEELSTPEKPVLQGTVWKQWNRHIKPIFTELGGVDIDAVLAPRPDRKSKAEVESQQD